MFTPLTAGAQAANGGPPDPRAEPAASAGERTGLARPRLADPPSVLAPLGAFVHVSAHESLFSPATGALVPTGLRLAVEAGLLFPGGPGYQLELGVFAFHGRTSAPSRHTGYFARGGARLQLGEVAPELSLDLRLGLDAGGVVDLGFRRHDGHLAFGSHVGIGIGRRVAPRAMLRLEAGASGRLWPLDLQVGLALGVVLLAQ